MQSNGFQNLYQKKILTTLAGSGFMEFHEKTRMVRPGLHAGSLIAFAIDRDLSGQTDVSMTTVPNFGNSWIPIFGKMLRSFSGVGRVSGVARWIRDSFGRGKIMRSVLALVVALWCGTADAQWYFTEDSYSSPDYGYGYSVQTYGWSGRLGSPLQPYYVDTYVGPDYGYGRTSSSFGYGTRYFDYGTDFDSGWPYRSSSRSRFMLSPTSRRHRW